ncbi:hypothetical protein FQN54_005670 [Arachnomyces sp. PD_36]|nr:hypothetical protein FQN54_005670 [Arachnomyces sp. PD_36]
MKEALFNLDSGEDTVSIVDSPIPKPNATQVVIKVEAAGMNPKDFKHKGHGPHNQGDDIAGYVESVGEKVTEFKKGDRVAAFHEMGTKGGAYAEYAVAWAHTTFHIPKSTGFEEAATIPLSAMTSALGLYQELRLPLPWLPATEPTPLIVYGGSSGVGAFAIKLAALSNIHPIIAVAGSGKPFVESLIDSSKGDVVLDYREGDEALISKIKEAAKGRKIEYAYDAISEHNSYVNIGKVLDQQTGAITTILPGKKYEGVPSSIRFTETYVGSVHGGFEPRNFVTKQVGKIGDREFGAAFYRFFGQGLLDGWFSGHPVKIVEGGLEGLQGALRDLKAGKVSSFKYVARLGDTPGVGK